MKNGFYKYMYEVLNESIQQTDLEFYEKNIYTGKSIDMGSVQTEASISLYIYQNKNQMHI